MVPKRVPNKIIENANVQSQWHNYCINGSLKSNDAL